MKRVCLNRLRTEAQHMANLITELDQTGAQELFDTLYRFCQGQKLESKLNTKECLKVLVGMMIEDIWSNFDNYAVAAQYVQRKQTCTADVSSMQVPAEQHIGIPATGMGQ